MSWSFCLVLAEGMSQKSVWSHLACVDMLGTGGIVFNVSQIWGAFVDVVCTAGIKCVRQNPGLFAVLVG